ncbi:MAG: hypothetical protein AAF065_08740 [Verrucomicrobiota bacterium]
MNYPFCSRAILLAFALGTGSLVADKSKVAVVVDFDAGAGAVTGRAELDAGRPLRLEFRIDHLGEVQLDAIPLSRNPAVVKALNSWDGSVGRVQDQALFGTGFIMELRGQPNLMIDDSGTISAARSLEWVVSQGDVQVQFEDLSFSRDVGNLAKVQLADAYQSRASSVTAGRKMSVNGFTLRRHDTFTITPEAGANVGLTGLSFNVLADPAPSPLPEGTHKDDYYYYDDWERGNNPEGASPYFFPGSLIEPTQPEKRRGLAFVQGAENTAGHGYGTGLMLYHEDAKAQTAMAINFIDTKDAQLSAVRWTFDFAYVEGEAGAAEMDVVLIGNGRGFEWGKKDFRLTSEPLMPDGTFAGHDVSDGRSHRMDVYANDKESELDYTDPKGRPGILKPNSVTYYIDGKLIKTEPMLEISQEGENGIGRYAWRIRGGNGERVAYIIDNIHILDLAPPLPQAPGVTELAKEVDGRLVYGKYANNGESNADNMIPDYSRAGYKGGGVPIPFVPAKITLSPSGGDDLPAIQAAIDKVAAMPKDANGFCGAVRLKAGTYVITDTILMNKSGVVLRGAGCDEVGGTRILVDSTKRIDAVRMGDNPSGRSRQDRNSQVLLPDSFVPTGAKGFRVSDASKFKVGDEIAVSIKTNQLWIEDIATAWDKPGRVITNRHQITAIEGDGITVDSTIIQPLNTRYGELSAVKTMQANAVRNIGLEAIRFEAVIESFISDEHPQHPVRIESCRNFWVRQVVGQYFRDFLVKTTGTSIFGTIEDSANIHQVAPLSGLARSCFGIDGPQNLLLQRLYSYNNQRFIQTGSGTPGPNAFVDMRGDRSSGSSGPHLGWAKGHLYDNVKTTHRLEVRNRGEGGRSGHGWTGVTMMLWNCHALAVICDAPVGAQSYSVGCIGPLKDGYALKAKQPQGIIESHGNNVTPRSLYYTQLRDRVGWGGLQDVILPAQAAGQIWSPLYDWNGDGLFGPRVVAWSNREFADGPVNLKARVRDLEMLDAGISVRWEKLSGPGEVTFKNPNALQTDADFTAAGQYILQVTVSAGSESAVATVHAPGPVLSLPLTVNSSRPTSSAIVANQVPPSSRSSTAASEKTDANEMRSWTSARGSQLEAKLIRREGTSVTLEGSNGRRLTIGIDQLSPQDRAFLEDTSAVKSAPKMETRIWTSTAGSKIQARLVSIRGSVVILEELNGSRREVRLEQLSQADRDYIATD